MTHDLETVMPSLTPQHYVAAILGAIMGLAGGAGSLKIIDPRPYPYTSIEAKDDKAEMKLWTIQYVEKYVEANVPPPRVELTLDDLTKHQEIFEERMRDMEGQLYEIHRKLDLHMNWGQQKYNQQQRQFQDLYNPHDPNDNNHTD